MKKVITSLLVYWATCIGVTAQTISVASDVEALASGETVSFKLHVAGVSAMTSMHFEVQLPSAFSVNSVDATSEWTAIFSQESGVVSAISTSANAFSGEGDIAMVQVVVPANTTLGEYTVTINNVRINGIDLSTTATFNINVVSVHSIVLNDELTTAPSAANDVNVRVIRTINANEWSTICLPFAMNATQVTTAFGNDVQLADLNEYDYDDVADKITLGFNNVTAIAANHPYIIKVTSKVTEFTVDGVDISPEDDPSVVLDNGKTGSKRVIYSTFTGTYVADFQIPYSGEDASLFLSGNQLWYATAQTKPMRAYRACFWFADFLSDANSAPSRITMSFNDSKTTVIKDGKVVRDNKVYNLSGQQVKNPAKGVYVKDGKKVIIK